MNTKIVFLLTFGATSLALHDCPAQVAFSRITDGPIVNDLGTWTRSAWGDFNNDGFLDLFVSNYGGKNAFYWNNGNGTFTKLTNAEPVLDAADHTGAAGADYDNDDHLDLVVSAGGEAPEPERNLLYHNNGNGTFSRVSGGAVTNQLGKFNACTWADFDNDGFVDLFVTDNGPNDAGGPNLLFRNNGDGTFTRMTNGAVVNDVGIGRGALWADYDNA